MRILIDEDLNIRLKTPLPGRRHIHGRVHGMEGDWTTGLCLDTAEQHGFVLIITGDTNMSDQQNLHRRTIACVLTDKAWPVTPEHEQELVARVDRFR